MAVFYTGSNPLQFGEDTFRQDLKVVNARLLKLEADLIKASPVGVSGQLKQGWTFKGATMSDPVAVLSNTQAYLLPVEMGRLPGKGINQQGQESVALWAVRVLGAKPGEAKGIAYALSQKYKRFGRKATGFMGLANPGDAPKPYDPNNMEPTKNGLIGVAFSDLANYFKQR